GINTHGNRFVNSQVANIKAIQFVRHGLNMVAIQSIEHVLVRQQEDVATDGVKNVIRPDMTTNLVTVHQQQDRQVVTIRIEVSQADFVHNLGCVGQIGMDCRSIKIASQVGVIQRLQVIDTEKVGI